MLERRKRALTKGPKFINFVTEGAKGKSGVEGGGILAMAADWEMRADIHQRIGFPEEVVSTSLRSDIVLWSRNSKQVLMTELTVPWEDRIEEARERKRLKFQQLVEDCQEQGLRIWCLPVEVGCQGFPGQSLWRTLRLLGVVGAERKKLMGAVSRQVEAASGWIWRKRDERWSGHHQQC
ncbi:uncharacterized protein [Argopecten irradians]|uniref:uncharacterized protein n=1 Tax=Argopecten irradians TaxID=31199 RepID=UPI003710F079